VAFEVSVGRFAGLWKSYALVGLDSGGGIRTPIPDAGLPDNGGSRALIERGQVPAASGGVLAVREHSPEAAP
jgi:hypothetical protein